MASVYDPSAYDNLPLLHNAGQMFEDKNGKDIVEDFRSLFQKYETDRVFGLILNHRHFDMAPNEETMHDKTRPSSWFVSENNKCLPYEFHYSSGNDVNEEDCAPDSPKYRDFVVSFNELLREKDALGLFGLCLYPGDDFPGRVEITAGRANINLHPDDICSIHRGI